MMPPSSDAANDGSLLWITEAQVASLVTINDAMDALRIGFGEEYDGAAHTVDKALGQWQGGAIQALGALMPRLSYAGFKTWAHTPNGATAIFSLFNTQNGQLLAVLEAATLGQIRTSAVSGLGADLLAAPNADEMSLIGTGAQALTQVAAIDAVRPLRRLRIFSRTPDRRAAFAARARAAFNCEVVECSTLQDAVAAAPIVVLMTRSTEPFLDAAALAPGTLIIAAGAILPTAAECEPDVLARSGLVAVDSLGNAQRNSRELIAHFGTAPEAWRGVQTLGGMLRHGVPAPAGGDLLFFKPMGSGLSDLAVAIMAYDRARAGHIGLTIAQPSRVSPQWRSRAVEAPN